MAKKIDAYDDFKDLLVDELDENFAKAANHLQTIQSSLETNTLLTLYGYYKQGLEGPCNIPKPNWYDMKGKSKWEAWKKLDALPKEEAKSLYIQTLSKIDPNFDIDKKVMKETWVTVSTLQSQLSEEEKNIKDFIQDDDVTNVAKLLQNQSNIKDYINTLDENGLSLLHWASDRGSITILKLLLENGAIVNLCDSQGQTPLHYAASCGHLDCVDFLLKKGGDVNIKDSDDMNVLDVSDDNVKDLIHSYTSVDMQQ